MTFQDATDRCMARRDLGDEAHRDRKKSCGHSIISCHMWTRCTTEMPSSASIFSMLRARSQRLTRLQHQVPPHVQLADAQQRDNHLSLRCDAAAPRAAASAPARTEVPPKCLRRMK